MGQDFQPLRCAVFDSKFCKNEQKNQGISNLESGRAGLQAESAK